MRRLIATMLAVLSAAPAPAAVVASSLPFKDTPDWSTVVFPATSMTSDGTIATLTTPDPRQGVWFGWRAAAPPAWTPAVNAVGNYFAMTFSLSAGARDWSAYLYDGSHYAVMIFNPTINCNGNLGDCTSAPFNAGISLYRADGMNQLVETFLPMNLTLQTSVEFLLKGGTVDYRVNGNRHAGAAQTVGFGPLLVVGDGSATTQTGSGQMFVHDVLFETGPAATSLPTIPGVPEPSSWAMLLSGFILTGTLARQRRKRIQVSA
jgi:hypothetical protein